MSIKENLRTLYRFTSLYGTYHGLRIFFSINWFNKINVTIPGLGQEITLRKNTSDIPTFFQIFLYGEYEIDFTNQPQVVVDGGANIGLFTNYVKRKFPDTKVICVEPDKSNFEQLKQNTSQLKNIFYENRGLWDKPANLKVSDKLNRGNWGMVVEESTPLDCNVIATTIPEIMQKYAIDKIDILKLDIETSEKRVFMNNFEDWLPKTKMIIVELHDFMEEGCARTFFSAVNSTISRYEYKIKGENTIIINLDLV